MGSYYHLNDRNCPYCGKKLDKVTFAECFEDYNAKGKWMGNSHKCEHCGKLILITMKFVLEKIE